MRGARAYSQAFFYVYTGVLLTVASFFLMRDRMLLQELHNKLPLAFMVRFGAFWFTSFALAVVLYLVHLRMNRVRLSRVERVRYARLGKRIFAYGASAAILAGLLFYTLYKAIL